MYLYICEMCCFCFFNQSYQHSQLTQYFFSSFQIKYFFLAAQQSQLHDFTFQSPTQTPIIHYLWPPLFIPACTSYRDSFPCTEPGWSPFFLVVFSFFVAFFPLLTQPAVFVTRTDIISASNGTTVAITSKSITRLKLLHIHRGRCWKLRIWAPSARLVDCCRFFYSSTCNDILLTIIQREPMVRAKTCEHVKMFIFPTRVFVHQLIFVWNHRYPASRK